MQLGEPRGEHRAQELPDGGAQGVLAAGQCVAQLARHPLAAERLGAGDAVGVEHEGGAPAGDELGDRAQRVGVCERALEFGVGDRVGLARLVAAGVADGLLAFAVAPAGAVGDQLALVAGEQVADDRLERLQLGVGGVDQAGAQVVAEAEVRARRLDLAGAGVGALRAVLLAGRAQLGVVEAGAGEVALLARDRVVAGFELLADRVEHEHGVDDPDAGGEVGAALVHVGVAAGAGALAQRAVDAQLARRRPGAGGERVELSVELVGRAAEDAGELSPVGRR